MDNLRGSLLMVLAMAAFALEDMAFKAATATLPVAVALILFGLGGAAVFMGLARLHGERIVHPAIFAPALLWRAAAEVTGRLCYALAIALTPLSSASAILQATPLVVALGAVVFFRERVGAGRWLAIALGFAGVLMILRPGPDGFEAGSLFAVLGMLGFAGRDLATRASPATMSNRQLGIYGFAMLVVAGLLLLAVTGGARLPGALEAGWLVLATGVGVIAYLALTAAMRTGEISVVTSFRYTRLVFAMLLGVMVFAERPDAMTLLGSAVIVASGLHAAWLGRRAARA